MSGLSSSPLSAPSRVPVVRPEPVPTPASGGTALRSTVRASAGLIKPAKGFALIGTTERRQPVNRTDHPVRSRPGRPHGLLGCRPDRILFVVVVVKWLAGF